MAEPPAGMWPTLDLDEGESLRIGVGQNANLPGPDNYWFSVVGLDGGAMIWIHQVPPSAGQPYKITYMNLEGHPMEAPPDHP